MYPNRLFELIYFPEFDHKLDELASLAEEESWEYTKSSSKHNKPILYNYIHYTYQRIADEGKISVSSDDNYLCFNTGLLTPNQEPIFVFCTQNTNNNSATKWFFVGWRRKGEQDMSYFSELPEIASYFSDASVLVYDWNKELRVNIEHVISDNKERFPDQLKNMSDYFLKNVLDGAINSAIERVKRNYKVAVPQYYRGKTQLLLPLCLSKPNIADLALVVTEQDNFYRASTCLTLDMAINNARLLSKPDRDWLNP
jgi:hypothetical protein